MGSFQKILKPTKYRAVDTSTSLQVTSSDMITNGSFASNITGWDAVSVGGGETAPAFDANDGVGSSGCCIIDVEDGGYIGIAQNLTFVAGSTYKVTLSAKAASGDSGKVIRVQDMASGIENNMSDGTHKYTLSESHQTFSTIWTASSDSTGLYIVRDTGTVADWEFFVDDIVITRVNTFGNNNHGQIYSGRGLEFDGVADYLSVYASGRANDLFGSYLKTFACWVKFYDVTSVEMMMGAAWLSEASITMHDGYIGAASSIRSGADDVKVNKTIEANTWYRLVVVSNVDVTDTDAIDAAYADGFSNMSIYLNGEKQTLEAGNSYRASQRILLGARYNGSFEYFLDGAMSDVQVWDKVWTQSDVTFDYLNPESLALNNGGTSLTESNLKVWYPMQDGHRGQQSYVLDGANTGTQDVLSGYGTFTDASKWDIHGSTTSEIYAKVDEATQTMRIKNDVGGTYIDTEFHDTTILEVGQTYKITVEVTDATSGAIRILPRSGNANQSSHAHGILNTVGTHEFYYASSEKTNIGIARNSSPCDITIKNLTVEAVNAKHHATTVFHGDEMIAAEDDKNSIFDEGDSGGTYQWAAYNESGSEASISYSLGHLNVVTGTSVDIEQGAQLPVDNFTALVVGRTYVVDVELDAASGTPTVKVDLGGSASASTAIDTTGTSYPFTVIPVNTTGALRVYTDDTDGIDFTIDNVKIREEGTATGWTDADLQLDIPQTALQSYNQLAWFDGVDDKVVIGDQTKYSFSADVAFSISAWINMNDATSFPIVEKYKSGNREYRFHASASQELQLLLYDESAAAWERARTGDILTAYENEWIHVVATYDGDESNAETGIRLYINGESQALTTDDNDPYTAMESLAGDVWIGASELGATYANGAITEVGIFDVNLTQAEVSELYNDGKAIDALTHSQESNIVGYWRNNGLASWQDLKNPTVTTFNGTVTCAETLLLPAGVDASRDNQGFLMNRQKDTNALNLNNPHDASENAPTAFVKVLDSPSFDHVDTSKSYFSVALWYKRSNASDEGTLFAKYDINSLREFDIEIVGNGHVEIQLGANSGAGYNRIRTRDGEIDTTDWTHLVVAYNGNSSAPETPAAWATDATGRFQMNGRIQVWRNGVEVSDGADEWQWLAGTGGHEAIPPAQLSELTGNISIGNILSTNAAYNAASAADAYWFDGQIDDVLYYTKTLSLAEVTRIYNAGKRSHR